MIENNRVVLIPVLSVFRTRVEAWTDNGKMFLFMALWQSSNNRKSKDISNDNPVIFDMTDEIKMSDHILRTTRKSRACLLTFHVCVCTASEKILKAMPLDSRVIENSVPFSITTESSEEPFSKFPFSSSFFITSSHYKTVQAHTSNSNFWPGSTSGQVRAENVTLSRGRESERSFSGCI